MPAAAAYEAIDRLPLREYGFNLGRLRDLEQRRMLADSMVRAYLLVIQKNPKAVKDEFGCVELLN